jgi:hypothetical protein
LPDNRLRTLEIPMEMNKSPCSCGEVQPSNCCGPKPLEMLPMYSPGDHRENAADDAPCCGPPAGPASSIHEKPGYRLCRFVEKFAETPVGPAPRIRTRLAWQDHLGTLRVRLGIGRNDYKVAPGLYALGWPEADAPVLVTANYKLSFDHLRSQLGGMDAWLLVLDTRGINVWCAAGKGTFGTRELIDRVRRTRLDQVVNHRKLILPQLGAPGVTARQVKKACGFEVVWGPVRASDLPAFLSAGCIAEENMRRVTFSMADRMVLVPVELALTRKPLVWTLLAIFLVSGLGPHFFSISAAWTRGVLAGISCLAGILAGCVAVPLFLPWIPGRAFAFKGTLAGLAAGMLFVLAAGANPCITVMSSLALVVLTTAVSSYLAMNFTGTTPFTSPSGVEKEMRRAIPLQISAVLIAVGLWIGAAF